MLAAELVDLGRVLNEAFDRLVAEAAAQLGAMAGEKNVAIAVDVHPARVVGDATALTQAANNLLTNAIKYNRPGGEVRVGVGAKRRHVTLTVADTGEGIPEADQPHLFERFYRVDKARSRAAGGTGLGLAICNSIVEAHGGTIGVESVPGKGTTFSVRLPRARRSRDLGRGPSSPHPAARTACGRWTTIDRTPNPAHRTRSPPNTSEAVPPTSRNATGATASAPAPSR